MKKSMVARLVVLGASLLATSFLACGDNSNSNACGTNGCSNGAWLHIPMTLSASALLNQSVTVCRNSECYTAALPAVPGSDTAGAVVDFTDATMVVGTIWQETNLTTGIDIEWRVSDASVLQNGDHYVVTLVSASGASTTLLDKTATYQTIAPNGASCPPVCTYEELTP